MFVLSQAARNVADRIAQVLMAIVRLASEKLERETAAIPLLIRLANLLQRCIHLSEGDVPTPRPAKPANPAQPATPRPPACARTTASAPPLPRLPPLPSRPGWLLQTLPDHAPALAAEFAAILADPAIAELLAASPALRRDLSLLLVLLALELPAEPPQAGPAQAEPAPLSHSLHKPPPLIPPRHLRPNPRPFGSPPLEPAPGP